MDWMPTNRNRKDYISCWYLLARQKDFRFIYMLHSSFGISCEIGCFYLPMSGDKKKSNPFGFIFIWMQCLQEISEEIKKTRAKIFDVSFMARCKKRSQTIEITLLMLVPQIEMDVFPFHKTLPTIKVREMYCYQYQSFSHRQKWRTIQTGNCSHLNRDPSNPVW